MLNLKNSIDNKLFSLMEAFVRETSGTSWCAVLSGKAGKYFLEMKNRPCFGEMRSYNNGSTRPEDSKPGDLDRPLPIGEVREAIGIPLSNYLYNLRDSEDFYRFAFAPDISPWKAGLPKDPADIHFIKDVQGKTIRGVVFTDGAVDATTMVNLFRFIRTFFCYGIGKYNEYRKSYGPLASLILATTYPKEGEAADNNLLRWSYEYHFSIVNSINEFRDGIIRNNARKPTWSEGDDYNRPDLGYLFVPSDINDPKKLIGRYSVPKETAFVSFKTIWDLHNVDVAAAKLKELGIS